MGRQTWDLPIDKHTEWSGDTSTSGLPVCGGRVEEFIKNTFEGKVGCIYYDTVYNRYMMFADEENRDTYLSDPEQYSTLLLGVFDAPFNYTATITLIDTPLSQFVEYGSVGNVIKAEFDTVNKNGSSVGEGHTVNITIRNGSSSKIISRQVSYGTIMELNLDDYLNEGNNIINIQAIGNDTLAATSQVVTFVMIRLELNDYFDISYPYNLNDTLVINFDVKGSGIKHMVWWLDGVQVEHDTDVDDITASESPILTRYIPFNLPEGRHNLQFRAYIDVDGRRFYSTTHFRDFIVKTNNNKIIVTSFDYPTVSGDTVINAFTMPIPLDGLKQYETKEINFAVYNPQATTFVTTVNFNGAESSYSTSNENVYLYQIKPTASGANSLSISASGAATISFNSIVENSDFNLYEISNCAFRFNGTDRTNSSQNKDQWSYSGYSATFSGFTWNESNGWVGDGFLIGNGQKLIFDYSPLDSVSVNNGATFEFDFSTSHVMDENAVLCDLRQNGVGIVITASEAKIISRGGVEVSTKYKSGEQVRISFVINRYSLGNNKGLVFIYVNGILSGAVPYGDGESFASNVAMAFEGTNNAYIKINQIMAYYRPLTYNEIINNYILYQTSFDGLLEKYRANDVYTDGTETLSIDKVSAKVPVIIITGDLEQLQNTTDKNKEVMMDKIEIINMDNPSLNLTLTNAIMRPQGTSSMSYPKKNFRIYSQRNSRTKMYDFQGNEVTDRLYAFKVGAQRVKVWCLKADYAESSSSHNTGVARLWNDVLKEVRITNINEHHYNDNQFVCRTQAQQTAIDNHFDGDVRTCIDGYPICLFYHLNENDPLIFVGKYNFNNDKSTESVFGFTDIPGFDNSNVECWEVTENGNTLALFTDTSNYDSRWSGCYEARYPDDSGKPSEAARAKQALKTFNLWVNSTKNDLAKFITEKWSHMDVYKMAAYYIYAMRFGAADQIVKNSMLTTEDGIHWFFINYDNDTILGLRNDGLLKFGPYITRQSKDPSDPTSYCYAGHDSVLWNNFEADAEFMSIVSDIDKALYNAGLNYGAMINMFNNLQSNKWGERIFNIDEQYKYLDVWNQSQNNQLEKLQGSRESHREWWISNRFNMYDEINLIGAYQNNNVEIKPTSFGVTGATINIRPSSNGHFFGYGINNTPIETGVSGNTSADITFVTPADTPLYIGDPVRFYNAKNIAKFDASFMAPYIQEATFSNINSNGEDSYMTDVILGSSGLTNNTLTQLGSISFVKYLKNLDIRNYQAITNLNLSNNKNLESVNASGCTSLTSVVFPEAAPINSVVLPGNLQSLAMKDVALAFSNFSIAGTQNISNINIVNCPNMVQTTGFTTMLMDWYNNKNVDNSNIYVRINNVNWTMSYNDMYYLGQINADGGHLELNGTVNINSALTVSQMATLMDLYGNNCFNPNSSFFFTYSIVPLSNVELSVNKNLISKNDSLIATVSFTGNDFRDVEFSVDDSTGLNIVKNGLSATISSNGNVSMRNVTLTCTITKSNGTTVSASTTFDIVPYYFFINNINFNNSPEFDLYYKNGMSAKTFNDGWEITCDDASLEYEITNVTISGGSAVFTGHQITSITKTALSDNTSYPCTVSIEFNNYTGVYNFDVITKAQGNIATVIYSITNVATPTEVLNSGAVAYCKSMKVDGVSVTPSSTYLFSTTGRHTVQFEFNFDYDLNNAWNNNSAIVEADLGDDFDSIGNNAFRNCNYLNKLWILNNNAPAISASTFDFVTYSSNNLLYLVDGASGYTTSDWTDKLLNSSYGNFNTELGLGWTGDENIRVVTDSATTVVCSIVNNTNKVITSLDVTASSDKITIDSTSTSAFTMTCSGITADIKPIISANISFADGTSVEVDKATQIYYDGEWFRPLAFVVSGSSAVTVNFSTREIVDFQTDWAVVNDYHLGDYDSYNWGGINYTRDYTKETATSAWTLSPGQTLFFKSNTITRYNYVTRPAVFSFTGGLIACDGNISALVGNVKTGSTLQPYVFYGLFDGQSNLVKPPVIDLIDIPRNGCSYMFRGTGITELPDLHSAVNSSYISFGYMFENCTGITSIPNDYTLPYVTYNHVYEGLFKGCTSLVTVNPNLFLNYVNREFNSQAQFINMFENCTSLTNVPDLSVFRFSYFVADGAFKAMFKGCTSLVSANTTLPFNSPAAGMYSEMFKNCTSLTTPPTIQAREVGANSMQSMFENCTSLVTPPQLNITGITGSMPMAQMFAGCTSLTSAPQLPATNLSGSEYAYFGMFGGCTSLTSAPQLPATVLGNSCFRAMFENCTSLTGIINLIATGSTYGQCYQYMFNNCWELQGVIIAASGDFNGLAIDAMMTNCSKVSSITFKAMTAPVNGTGTGEVDLYQNYVFYENTGTNSGTNNTLYVPQGSTGWDTAPWLADLLDPTKGNFTISYTAQ